MTSISGAEMLSITPNGQIDYYKRYTEVINFGNLPLMTQAAGCFAVGYIQYIYSVLLVRREGKGTFPLWMHTFYFAHDSYWAITLLSVAPQYNWHWFLWATPAALSIWSCIEIYCLYMAMTVEREEIFGPLFGPKVTFSQALQYTVMQILLMYALLLVGVTLMGEGCTMHWFSVTAMLMTFGPPPVWIARGSREGASLGFAITTFFGMLMTFSPSGFYVQVLPEVFDRPVYYFAGVIMTILALNNIVLLASYPAKVQKKGKPQPVW